MLGLRTAALGAVALLAFGLWFCLYGFVFADALAGRLPDALSHLHAARASALLHGAWAGGYDARGGGYWTGLSALFDGLVAASIVLAGRLDVAPAVVFTLAAPAAFVAVLAMVHRLAAKWAGRWGLIGTALAALAPALLVGAEPGRLHPDLMLAFAALGAALALTDALAGGENAAFSAGLWAGAAMWLHPSGVVVLGAAALAASVEHATTGRLTRPSRVFVGAALALLFAFWNDLPRDLWAAPSTRVTGVDALWIILGWCVVRFAEDPAGRLAFRRRQAKLWIAAATLAPLFVWPAVKAAHVSWPTAAMIAARAAAAGLLDPSHQALLLALDAALVWVCWTDRAPAPVRAALWLSSFAALFLPPIALPAGWAALCAASPALLKAGRDERRRRARTGAAAALALFAATLSLWTSALTLRLQSEAAPASCAVAPVAFLLDSPFFMHDGPPVVLAGNSLLAAALLDRTADGALTPPDPGAADVRRAAREILSERSLGAARWKAALLGVTHILVCGAKPDSTSAAPTLKDRLQAGSAPDWLTPVPWPSGVSTDLKLYRLTPTAPPKAPLDDRAFQWLDRS